MAKTIANNPFELNKALNSSPFTTLMVLAKDKTIRKDNILFNAIRQMIENFKRFMRYNAYSMIKGVIPFANGKSEGVECGYYDYAKTPDYQLKMSQLKNLLGISPLYDSPYIQEKYEVLKSIYPEASFLLQNGEFHMIERIKLTKEQLQEQRENGLPKEKYKTEIKNRLFVMDEAEYKEFRKSLQDTSRAVTDEEGKLVGVLDKFRPEMLIKEVNNQYIVNVECPEVRAFVGKTLLNRNITDIFAPAEVALPKEPDKEPVGSMEPTEPEEPLENPEKDIPFKQAIYEHTMNGGEEVHYTLTEEKAEIFKKRMVAESIPFFKLATVDGMSEYVIRDIDKERTDKILADRSEESKLPEPDQKKLSNEKEIITEKPDISPDREPFIKEHMTSNPELEIYKAVEVEVQPDRSLKTIVNGLECLLYEAGGERTFEVFDVTAYRGENKNVIIPSKIEFDGTVYSLESIYPGAFEGKDIDTIQVDARGLEDLLSSKEAINEAFCLGKDIHGRPCFPTIYWTGLTENQYDIFKEDVILAKKFLADYERASAPERVVDITSSITPKEKEVPKSKKQEKEVEKESLPEKSKQQLQSTHDSPKKKKKGFDL